LKVRDFSELLYDAWVNVNDLVDIYREDMSNDYKDRLRDKDTNLINNKSYEYINDLDDLFDKN
jgi:hypothetical protein